MITCFLLTPTGEASVSLRRYTLIGCGDEGHYAEALIGTAPLVLAEHYIPDLPADPADPRWPTHCQRCGYAFSELDRRVRYQEPLYQAPDGTRYTVRRGDAPAGAMWVADWIPEGDDWTGPDGKCLYLRLPDGTDWMIDGPSRSGGRWTRTGTPPKITAQPSIASPGYHGWLVDGVLSPDLEGRTYG